MVKNKQSYLWSVDLQQKCQNHLMREKGLLHNWCWDNKLSTNKRMKLESTIHHVQKLLKMVLRIYKNSKFLEI